MDYLSNTTMILLTGICGFLLIIWMILRLINNCYIKAAPNEAVVVFGRGKKSVDGKVAFSDIYTSGGRIVWPVIEGYSKLYLNVIPIELTVKDVPNANGVKITVKGTANIKIKSDPISLQAAAERFLNLPTDGMKDIAYRNLEGHLRSIVSQMTIENLLKERQEFNGRIMDEVSTDLDKLGLGIDFLTIQEVTDNEGYTDAMGEKRTAEIKRDAVIGRAEADSEAKQKSSDATRCAETVAAQNDTKIAEAKKELDIKKAQYSADVAREEAYAEQAGPLATAEKEKEVVIAQQNVERVRREKEAEVAKAAAIATEEQLKATLIKPAEAERLNIAIKAEAEKRKTIVNAEAAKEKTILDADAQKEKIMREALAEAEKIRQIAEANKTRVLAQAQAEAESIKLRGIAQAEATAAVGKAEAEAIEAKANAYEKLDQTGRLLQVIEAVGEVGPSVIRELSGVAKEIAAPIGNVDKIQIVDFGGEGKGVGSLTKFVPSVSKQLLEGLRAVGLEPKDLIEKFGLKEAGEPEQRPSGVVAAKEENSDK